MILAVTSAMLHPVHYLRILSEWIGPQNVLLKRSLYHLSNTYIYIYIYIYTGCPKKVETRFNFLAIEDKHAV